MKMIVNSPECGSIFSTEVTLNSSLPCSSCPVELTTSYSDCLNICWVSAPVKGCIELSSSSCHFLYLNTWSAISFHSSPTSIPLSPSVAPLWLTYRIFGWYLMNFFNFDGTVQFFHWDRGRYLPSRSWFPFVHGSIVFPWGKVSSTPHYLPLNFLNCYSGFEFCWGEADFPTCNDYFCPLRLHYAARGCYWTTSKQLFPPVILCSF